MAANPRISTQRLAVASCALGMLTYVGIGSLISDTGAPARQAQSDRPQQSGGAADGQPPSAVPHLGPQDAGAAGSIR